MDMDMTITLKDAGLIIIGTGLIILIAYCIAFMKNLVVTIKHTNRILEDTQAITKIAAERTKDVDKVLSGLKDNQSIVSIASTIIQALGALKNLTNRQKK